MGMLGDRPIHYLRIPPSATPVRPHWSHSWVTFVLPNCSWSLQAPIKAQALMQAK
jgi:hypothetical protein